MQNAAVLYEKDCSSALGDLVVVLLSTEIPQQLAIQ